VSNIYDMYRQSLVRGKDGKAHRMSLNRKSAPGVGQFSDVTKFMTMDRLLYVRMRAKKTRYEAQQREFILHNPYRMIRELIVKR